MLKLDGYYVLRTPRISIDYFIRKTAGLTMAQLSAFLKETYKELNLDETLYLASPELYQQYIKWLGGELDKKQEDKLLITLFKYLLRMSSRSTPFGLFAGCATGDIANDTRIVVSTQDRYITHSRLDMNYVGELASLLAANPLISGHLKYFPNSSIYRVHDQYRYAGYSINNKIRSYKVISVNYSPYLEKILEAARNGVLLRALVPLLMEEDITEEEAQDFIGEIVSSQILLSELEPTVTGEEFFYKLKKNISLLPQTDDLSLKLERIADLLEPGDNSLARFQEIFGLIKSLGVDTTSKDLIQTDLFFRHESNQIGQGAIQWLLKDAEKLYRLFPYTTIQDQDNFKSEFYARYEDQEIPLAMALDADVGVGYGLFRTNSETGNAPLIDGVGWNDAAPDNSMLISPLGMLKIKKYTEALKRQETQILITEEEIQSLAQDSYRNFIPSSLFMIGDLLAGNASDVDNGNFEFVLKACSGPSAGNLLARFCHGDPELAQRVHQAADKEKMLYADQIVAEIVHLPSSRMGNVLLRPLLREYEIPYLCTPGTTGDFTLTLDDLFVSVKNNRIVLRSRRLNKEILPRLTTAHGYGRSTLMIYKFLCDLQYQGAANSLFWNWGILDGQEFLPRVQVGRIIVSKAAWNLNKKDYPELEIKGTDHLRFIDGLRNKLKLPRYVVLVEGENELMVDLTNEVNIRILVDEWKKKGSIRLAECLSTPENCFIKDGQGRRYVNEFIFPISSDQPQRLATINFETQKGTTKRSFGPGSEWLYIKLYSGTSASDLLLATHIYPIAERLLRENKIQKWFYIRFFDPDSHIRLRFYNGAAPDFWAVVMEQLHSELVDLLDMQVISRFQIDTYKREIERYGEDSMEVSETIFFHDSMAIAQCLQLLEGEDSELYRWLFSLKNIDCLLNDFNFPLAKKLEFITGMRDSFFREFNGNVSLNQDLNENYRKNSAYIRDVMGVNNNNGQGIPRETDLGYSRLNDIFAERSNNWAYAIAALGAKGELVARNLLPSYIHMSLNRLFVSSHRKHELVIYHFLQKFYGSQLAIAKAGKAEIIK